MIRRLVIGAAICAGALCAKKQDEQSIKNAVDAYRRMWEAMTPDQRKTLVDAGGGTPERYEQTLRLQPGAGAPKAAGGTSENKAARTDLQDTVRTSSEDRHAIRDANLTRLRDEACPPEVALQVAALRSTFAPVAMPPTPALLAIADSWFQRTELPSPAAAPVNVKADLERLLAECKK